MTQHGPWFINASEVVYHDPWLSLRCDQVTRPDGQPGTYSVVTIKSGVSVLAMNEEGFVYLTDEFHYAIGRQSLETVSGGIDDKETAEQAARRELAEELGLIADELISLGTVDPFTGSLLSPTELFLARGISETEANPEGTELIEMVKVSFAEAVEKVMSGEITHAPSCVLILKAEKWLKSERS
ncbi:NUDIX hydrolase [Planctomycetaceae bacterium]|jgi:ADP-ribose pyrophosphatase|nr:NUDIX hydrolase [Planctomycetaceae bacterium]MDC0308117.1 NUDIX hydrolase [Planctomycetaceae bacterium]MDG2391398.1 NUDIX hydrolase [Planctomycetaceae bacterium]